MKVLVCGGRDFADKHFMFEQLDFFHSEFRFSQLIHGAARGADTLSGVWAKSRSVPVSVFSADWQTYGKAAGHIRNSKMLEQGKPDLVLGFFGGNGTEDMIRKSKFAGVKTIHFK